MGKKSRKAPSPLKAEAIAVLARLAPPGSFALASAGQADSDYAVFATQAGGAEVAQARVPRAAVARGLRNGWLERERSSKRVRITRAGVEVMRTAKRAATAEKRAQAAALQAPPESSLQWLRGRKDRDGQLLITEAQLNAGERLAADYLRAQLNPRVTSNWTAAAPVRRTRRGAPGFGVELTDAAVAARERVNRALRAVGPELGSILIDVCCHSLGLEAAERAERWPQRSARIVLQLALTRLARHYGLIAPERPIESRLRHWGDADYRPTLDSWQS